MADKKKPTAGGDAPSKKEPEKKEAAASGHGTSHPPAAGKGKEKVEPVEDEPVKTPSQLKQEEAEYRSMMRRERFKRRWPEITKPRIKTRKWHPPGPPQRMPAIAIELPDLKTRTWVPPYRRRKRQRPRLARIPPDQVTRELYEHSKLRKIWHSFYQVDKNKMMLQGSTACNSKRYSTQTCGAQTACIAVACRGLLEMVPASEFKRCTVDELIETGDRYYHQCMVCMKCYKGKPQLEPNQLVPSFFLRDTKVTVKLSESARGILAKHPDDMGNEPDLMSLMDKFTGQKYMMILSAGDKHFLVWGHPPEEAGSSCRTVCYILDPHMLDQFGRPHPVSGAGAFLRFAGINSFVTEFLTNYGELDAAKRGKTKAVVLTDIDVVQMESLERKPTYALDLKTLKPHCQDEWECLHMNALLDQKKGGMHVTGCLSAVSVATSRATSRKKVAEFYQKQPKEPMPTLPVPPERAPPCPTDDQIMQMRGENFFLYCPRSDGHAYGRDDLVPRPKSETVLYSPVEIAQANFHSQYQQLDAEKWILRGTRHFASYKYQTFKTYTAVACCAVACATLRRLRARAWNEDVIDETLDFGYNLYRESLLERGGPIRRLVLGELKESFKVRDKEYHLKCRGIAVWGKLISNDPKVFDLCRGIEAFFMESDCGLLQIPGEYEMCIWNEGGVYYLYHPWPSDRYGQRVGLQDGGKASVLCFTKVSRLCEHVTRNTANLRKKPFSISDVTVVQKETAEAVNDMKAVAPNRWVVRGRFHEGDERFPEEHRNRQATAASVAAVAQAHLVDPLDWTADTVDDTLVRGDVLYEDTMEHLDKMGISIENPHAEGEEGGEDEEGPASTSGTLAAADVLNRFRMSEYDCIETDVMDCLYTGQLNPEPGTGVMSLKDSLQKMFGEYTHGVLTARGESAAVWRSDDALYYFDPHGCDENGLKSDDLRATACLVRVDGTAADLANVIMGNLPPGADDSFNLSPVLVTTSRLRPELGAPETKLESKQFEWISKGTAAIMMGPRGENSAIGKAAKRAGVPEDDLAGRTIALPAAAAFAAASVSVPPPHMHQDHMYNMLEAGAEYYLNHVKKTGRKEILPTDLTEKFEMGANTFSIELTDLPRQPLRLPDEAGGEGEGEEEEKEGLGEGEEEEVKEQLPKQIKDLLVKQWEDKTKPAHVNLLVGDYHQMGVWVCPGGQVVGFDPAPTLHKGLLTPQRIRKGDELRLQRIKDEMSGEGGGDEEDEEDEEAGAEGEAQPEPEPESVPPESCPVLIVAASPQEFIDKLTQQGKLDLKQCLAPYKLYPVTVTNELTSVLKEKRGGDVKTEEGEGEGDESEALVEKLEDAAIGEHFTRVGRAVASVRGRLGQSEDCFMEQPNRDHQDSANSMMGIIVNAIEPYKHWKPSLIDAILKYGDRLYTTSLPRAAAPPWLKPTELQREMHVTSFNVRTELSEDNQIHGDVKAGESGSILSLKRALKKFFESNSQGILCCKDYCVAIWRAADDKAYCLWEPHAVGPAGRTSPVGGAGVIAFSNIPDMAECYAKNVENVDRIGSNKFCITPVKVVWELAKLPGSTGVQAGPGGVPDEGYEWKVLTAYVEVSRGKTILRGSRPVDVIKYARDAVLQSSCTAVAGACLSRVRRAALWTRRTLDAAARAGHTLCCASRQALGFESRPGEDTLLPLQVLKRFILGVNYVRYDMQEVFSGRLEQNSPQELNIRSALERFFQNNTLGVVWCAPYAVAVWKEKGAPPFYMLDPHACGPTGLRLDGLEDGAPCVMTFSSAKLLAYTYLQNFPMEDRRKREFNVYTMAVAVNPIEPLNPEPPMVKDKPGGTNVPATSRVDIVGRMRRADEMDRKHPPGSATCLDAQRAADERDLQQGKLKGERNATGWLVLLDGTQYLSARHSMACKKFPYASRGNQALACSVMAVAMTRVEDVCRWCSSTLDQVLESGDQLYQDSYLHYRPKNTTLLNIEQILRKFYTPGNCVCRVVVYKARQEGSVSSDLLDKLSEFFREEKAGVLVAGRGDFAVALFKTRRGYYMFDAADRDRYGRAVAPPCRGRARACLSYYPTVRALGEKLGPNIPPSPPQEKPQDKPQEKRDEEKKPEEGAKEEGKDVHFNESTPFSIYGMDVTGLRRLNKHER